MPYQNTLLIPAFNGVMDGSVIDADPNEQMALGTNLSGLVNWEYTLAPNDLMKVSDPWHVSFAGSGSYAINEQDQLTSLTGDTIMAKLVIVNDAPNLPPGGTYTVRQSGNSGEISLGAAGSPGSIAPWTSATEFTFTHTEGASIYLFARGGAILDVKIICPGEVARYDAGNWWRLGWYDHIAAYNPRCIRPIIPVECKDVTLAQRTTAASLSWATEMERGGGVQLYSGAVKVGYMPIEAQVNLCNQLNVPLWYVSQPYASEALENFELQYAQDNLNQGLAVYVEKQNEPWNRFGPFFHTTLRIGTIGAGITLREFTTTPGSNVWQRTAHGFTEGAVFYALPSPNSTRWPVWPSHYFHNESNFPNSSVTRFKAINVTADTFETVLDDGLDTPMPAPTGATAMDAWLDSEHGGEITDNEVAWGHGQASDNLFNRAASIFTNRTFYKVIGTFLLIPSQAVERTGPNGCNGNFDLIAHGFYWNSGSSWAPGQSFATMRDNDIAYIDNLFTTAIQGHIDAGFPAAQQCAYEIGQHWVVSSAYAGTTSEQNAAFEAYNFDSSEIGETYDHALGGLAQRGCGIQIISGMDASKPGFSGYWGAKRNYADPETAKSQYFIDQQGYVSRT